MLDTANLPQYGQCFVLLEIIALHIHHDSETFTSLNNLSDLRFWQKYSLGRWGGFCHKQDFRKTTAYINLFYLPLLFMLLTIASLKYGDCYKVFFKYQNFSSF